MHMLRKAKDVQGYALDVDDGVLGKIEGFYFDDSTWTVRYLAVNPVVSLNDKKRLFVSPIGLGRIDDAKRSIRANLTTGQATGGPSLDLTQPLLRHVEASYYRYFGWPVYWGGKERWGASPYPVDIVMPGANDAIAREKNAIVHLRNTRELIGHALQTRNGEIGHVEDTVIDDETWAIRYLAVDTRNVWPGKEVLVSPLWIDRANWRDNVLYVDLLHDLVRNAPEYDPSSVITRSYESQLFKYYGREDEWRASQGGRRLEKSAR